MKILMVLENEFRKDGRVEKEISTLHKAGHTIIIAAINRSDLPLVEERKDCTVVRKTISSFIMKSSVGALKFPFYFSFWRKYLRETVSKYKPDAIHIHDLPLACIGTEIKKETGINLILDLHENWPALLSVSSHTNTVAGRLLSSEKQWRNYERKYCAEADAVITVADEMKARITQHGSDSSKTIVLENTPPTGSVNELKYERDEKYFTLIYVGGISYHRGVQYVIEGIKQLIPEIPVRLWIVGDGRFLPVLKKQVSDLDLEKYVTFFGHISKPDDLLKKSDIGLIPHVKSEQSDNSSPNKLYEYMAAGLPVLASNCNSVKRVTEETGSGKTYIWNSPEDFASKIMEFYSERNHQSIFEENGKRWVKEKYNWETGSSSLVKMYNEFASKK
jgi:glycosyltransferase involved in cell wall biosynthesis